MQGTYNELNQDFTDEEIEDQLGDIDFANDFAEQLFDALKRLKVQCEITVKDTKERKARLTKALVWGDFGVEGDELMQLSADGTAEATLMAHFYDNLAGGCNEFFEAASKKFAQDGKDLGPTITALGKHKHIIMNYARDQFHGVKGNIIDIVDSLIDSQRAIESVEHYNLGKLKYFKKNIAKESWKFQLKYSTMITKYCNSNNARIAEFAQSIEEDAAAIATAMGKVETIFKAKAQRDLRGWDCDAMYPEP